MLLRVDHGLPGAPSRRVATASRGGQFNGARIDMLVWADNVWLFCTSWEELQTRAGEVADRLAAWELSAKPTSLEAMGTRPGEERTEFAFPGHPQLAFKRT